MGADRRRPREVGRLVRLQRREDRPGQATTRASSCARTLISRTKSKTRFANRWACHCCPSGLQSRNTIPDASRRAWLALPRRTVATNMPTPGLSLKARALQWLSRREHSRQELRSKLRRLAQATSPPKLRPSSTNWWSRVAERRTLRRRRACTRATHASATAASSWSCASMGWRPALSCGSNLRATEVARA